VGPGDAGPRAGGVALRCPRPSGPCMGPSPSSPSGPRITKNTSEEKGSPAAFSSPPFARLHVKIAIDTARNCGDGAVRPNQDRPYELTCWVRPYRVSCCAACPHILELPTGDQRVGQLTGRAKLQQPAVGRSVVLEKIERPASEFAAPLEPAWD
jgi:hypothetical protein